MKNVESEHRLAHALSCTAFATAHRLRSDNVSVILFVKCGGSVAGHLRSSSFRSGPLKTTKRLSCFSAMADLPVGPTDKEFQEVTKYK